MTISKQFKKNVAEYLYSINFPALQKILLSMLLVVMMVTATLFITLYRHYQVTAHQISLQHESISKPPNGYLGKSVGFISHDTNSTAFSHQILSNTIKVTIGLIILFGLLLLLVRYVFTHAESEVAKYKRLAAKHEKLAREMRINGAQPLIQQT